MRGNRRLTREQKAKEELKWREVCEGDRLYVIATFNYNHYDHPYHIILFNITSDACKHTSRILSNTTSFLRE